MTTGSPPRDTNPYRHLPPAVRALAAAAKTRADLDALNRSPVSVARARAQRQRLRPLERHMEGLTAAPANHWAKAAAQAGGSSTAAAAHYDAVSSLERQLRASRTVPDVAVLREALRTATDLPEDPPDPLLATLDVSAARRDTAGPDELTPSRGLGGLGPLLAPAARLLPSTVFAASGRTAAVGPGHESHDVGSPARSIDAFARGRMADATPLEHRTARKAQAIRAAVADHCVAEPRVAALLASVCDSYDAVVRDAVHHAVMGHGGGELDLHSRTDEAPAALCPEPVDVGPALHTPPALGLSTGTPPARLPVACLPDAVAAQTSPLGLAATVRSESGSAGSPIVSVLTPGRRRSQSPTLGVQRLSVCSSGGASDRRPSLGASGSGLLSRVHSLSRVQSVSGGSATRRGSSTLAATLANTVAELTATKRELDAIALAAVESQAALAALEADHAALRAAHDALQAEAAATAAQRDDLAQRLAAVADLGDLDALPPAVADASLGALDPLTLRTAARRWARLQHESAAELLAARRHAAALEAALRRLRNGCSCRRAPPSAQSSRTPASPRSETSRGRPPSGARASTPPRTPPPGSLS